MISSNQQSSGLATRLRVACAWAAAILSLPLVSTILYPDISDFYLPSVTALSLGVVACFASALVRNELNRFVVAAWLAWYFIGTLNALSSYMVLGPHYRPYLDQPTVIYFGFSTAMFVGMAIAEAIWQKGVLVRPALRKEFSPLVLLILAVFCVMWAVILVAYAGYVPILSGVDITESIYETNYGPLYGFGLALVVASAAFCVRSMLASRSKALAGVVMILHITAISLMDGKRYLAILIVLACCFAVVRIRGGRRARGVLCALLGVALVVYLAMFVIRQGDAQRYGDGWLSATFIAGVEFRDFVYTVSRYQPGTIPEYDWFTSSVASMANSGVLAVAGVDKAEIVSRGSAFAWSRILSSPYGIRTGIVSELWFAYGWLGLLVVSLLGLLTSRISIWAVRATTDRQLVNGCVLLALLTSSIMGQATSVFGSMTVLLYMNIAFVAASCVERIGKRAGAVRRIRITG